VNTAQELDWARLAQEGDRAAFGRLVEAYQGPVFNLCYRMLGNPDEAADAAQETFVRIYSKLHTYQPGRKLASWILSIASHYCVDRLRRHHGEMLSLDDEPVAAVLSAHQAGPEESVMQNETRNEVQRALNRLEPAYRVPLILRYWYDLSYIEIAEVMGLTVQAVKSRLHRARQQMVEVTSSAGVTRGAVAPVSVR
jgi:RNA polymerase sigma-70 factor (ECF subfamily)